LNGEILPSIKARSMERRRKANGVAGSRKRVGTIRKRDRENNFIAGFIR